MLNKNAAKHFETLHKGPEVTIRCLTNGTEGFHYGQAKNEV